MDAVRPRAAASVRSRPAVGSIQLNNNEIAAALGWTEARSRSMCLHILQKLSAADRTQTRDDRTAAWRHPSGLKQPFGRPIPFDSHPSHISIVTRAMWCRDARTRRLRADRLDAQTALLPRGRRRKDLVRHISAGTTTSAQLTYALTTKWGPVKGTKCVLRELLIAVIDGDQSFPMALAECRGSIGLRSKRLR